MIVCKDCDKKEKNDTKFEDCVIGNPYFCGECYTNKTKESEEAK